MIPLAIYLLLGTGAAWWFDHKEMQGEVPYADWPSVLSLPKLRVLCLILNLLFGPLFCVRAWILEIRYWYKVKRAFYILKKQSKKVPKLYELVLELERDMKSRGER